MEQKSLGTDVANLLPLLAKLRGHLEKGNTNPVEHVSGVPRGWSRNMSLSSMEDADIVETYFWANNPNPILPRTQKRMKKSAAGRVCIIRDTSMSMQGMWNRWASLLCTNVMTLSKKQKMRVGYLEFNTRAQKFVDSNRKQFFTHEYDSLAHRMSVVKCEGLTNYEAPLSIALDEFEAIGRQRGSSRIRKHFNMNSNMPRNNIGSSSNSSGIDFGGKGSTGIDTTDSRMPSKKSDEFRYTKGRSTDQHILFITDGQPTSGDRFVNKELERAQRLGVSIHTVFIGYRSCPKVLDRLSNLTSGSKWASYFCPNAKSIQVVDRESGTFDSHGKDIELRMVDRMTRMPTVFQRYLKDNNLTL